jgi:hypothetical protein
VALTQAQARARILNEARDLAARMTAEDRRSFRRELEGAIAGADRHRAAMVEHVRERRRQRL